MQNAERSWALGVMPICQYPDKKSMVAKRVAPPQAVKGILNVRNVVVIFAGDGIDAPIIHTKTIRAIGLLGKANRGGPG